MSFLNIELLGWENNDDRELVEKELRNFSYKTIKEFLKLFPIKQSLKFENEKIKSYNYFLQNIIPKEGQDYIVNITMLYDNTYPDFWYRWNRFKKLKAFL